MKTKTIKWFSRVAMMLLMTMLTTATAWADDVNLTENTSETEGTAERWYVNIPKTGENKLTLTDASITFFKVYDNGGGPQNHYDNDCDGSLVLTAPEGCVLRLSGTIITEKGYDYLSVYDGNAKDDKKVLLNEVSSSSSGAETTIDAVTSTGQSMTLYFHSDNAVKYFGLNLTVTVVNLSEKFTITVNNPEAGGTIEASVGGTAAAQASMTDVVTLTATPASGYLLCNVSVVDANSNPVAVDCNFSTNIATFTMPRSAVTVTPTFTDTWTAEGGFFINMPKAGDKLITIPTGMQSFKVYDDGGATGNYSYNCDGTLTLTAPEGYVLQLSGSIRTENTRDNLTVYDGSDNSGTVLIDALYSYNNNSERAIPTVNSTGQSLTLYFYSDGSDNFAGLDLTVMLVSTSTDYDITLNSPVTGGSVSASIGENIATQAKINDVITLTATPESGYLLSNISVVDANSNPVAVKCDGSFDNTATFSMPLSAVTVTPTFTDTWTAEGGLYVIMPKTGNKSITIPAGVQSFKVYDDGGAGERYSDNSNSTLTLTAPEGYALRLSGQASIQRSFWEADYLSVYDGSTKDDNKLLINKMCNEYFDGTPFTIPTVNSTGQSMTIYFYSDDFTTYSGLNLTVTLVSTSTLYDITLSNPVTGGSISASIGENIATQAKLNDVITLTASPESGYLLKSISVVDAYSNPIAVNWNIWDNTATFSMPLSAVTVTPTFATYSADGLSVNIPATGSKSAIIPTGVQSLKVYDEGGASGNYGNDFDGTLILTAPEGYVLQLSGSITSENNCDYLSVYDGNTQDDEKVLLDAVSSSSSGTETAINTVTSMGQSMTLYFHSDGSENYSGLNLTVSVITLVALADNADNSTAITDASDQQRNVRLTGRTLYKNGNWNTLCLPFAMTAEQIAASPLAGATIKTLDNSDTGTALSDAGVLTLKFNTVYDPTNAPSGSIEAGKPYIIKWETTGTNIVNPVFTGVTITSTTPTEVTSNDGKVTFVGQYSPFSIVESGATGDNEGNKNEIILMTSNNKLGYSQNPRTLKCFRCHFYVPANDGELSARSIVVDFGDGETTEIGTINNNRETIANNQWYTLDGRKLTGKPTTKGVYIHNGRKEVVR